MNIAVHDLFLAVADGSEIVRYQRGLPGIDGSAIFIKTKSEQHSASLSNLLHAIHANTFAKMKNMLVMPSFSPAVA